MATGFPTPAAVVISSNGIIPNAPSQGYAVTPIDSKAPYIETWNFAIQRSLPGDLALDVSYMANHALYITNSNVVNGTINLNAAMVAGQGAASEPLNILFGRTATTIYPWYQGSHYDALQVKLNRRFSKGFLMNASYAYGKPITRLITS
jgi:hypothetical protein